jgi:outer membrane receptor protein involved in Fe transport
MNIMRWGNMLLAIVAVVFFVPLSEAQITTGTISGTVADSSGAVLPGAKIEILNEGTGAVRTVATGADGHYSAPSLGVGYYRLTATMPGFQTELRSGIVLTIGREAVIDLKMTVGAVAESVEVSGEAPLVETTQSAVSYLVNDRTLRDLPLNGRDMSQLILLNPGVTLSVNSNSQQGFNGFGKRISISGMRGEDNIYLLDGGLIGDFRRHIPTGPSGALLGIETVQEFQVLTNSFGAQYGRVLGGVFNSVSKSGTNDWHGDAYDYLRNSALDARNFFDRRTFSSDPRLPPFRRNQFGATFGGPIKKDKAFFFVAYESTREVLGETLFATVPDANARLGIIGNTRVTVADVIKPYLNAYPLPSPNGRNFGGGIAQFIYGFKQPTTEHFGQTRFDYQISSSDSFFARFTGSNSLQTSAPGVTGNGGANGGGGGVLPGFEQHSSLGAFLVTLSETHIVSPTTLNTARFHFNRVNPLDVGKYPPPAPGVLVTPGQSVPPEVDPGSGVTNFGGQGALSTAPSFMISNRFTYQDDVSWTRGTHSLQFGGFIERFQLNSLKPNRANGVWTFASLTNFLQGIVQNYRGAAPGFGTYQRGFRNLSFAAYIQDNWRLSPKLTLNLGVRWEPYTVPIEVNGLISNLRHITDTQGSVGSPYWRNKSWKEIGPRAGLAWSPFASGKTSVRAGFALLYEPNDPNQYYSQMDRQPPLAFDFTIPDTGHFPDALAEIKAQNTPGPAYSLPFDNNKSPHAVQYNFNIQQQLGVNNLVSVGYSGSRGIDLLGVGDINMPRAEWDGVSLAFPATARLVNPAWPSIIYFGNDTSSWYNGILVSFQRRFSKGFQAQASYTHAVGIAETDSGQTGGGVSAGGGREKYPNDRRAQKGLSGYDFRHVFTFNYSYDLPLGRGKSGIAGHLLSGWQTTGILSVRTGQPQSVFAAISSALTPLAVNTRSPNAVPGFTRDKIVKGGPDQYFDPNAYSAPGTRELGNLGRNTLVGPGSVAWNPALFKKTSLTERTSLEFRVELFNALNRANFGTPASQVFTGTGGPVTNAGLITTTTTTSRQIQLALKLLW